MFLRDGLGSTYGGSLGAIEGDPVTVIKRSLLTTHRLVRITAALDELEPLIRRHSANPSLELIRRFLGAGELGKVSRLNTNKRTSVCMQHGDMHGSNVLVVSSGAKHRPKLIDYANIARLPWPTDIVRFLVDVAISCLDAGEEGYEWGIINNWSSLLPVLTLTKDHFGDGFTSPTNAAAKAAVSWISRSLFEAVSIPDTAPHRFEYLLALAIELMRVSYRKEELPPSKRAFGLVAAEYALLQAESLALAKT